MPINIWLKADPLKHHYVLESVVAHGAMKRHSLNHIIIGKTIRNGIKHLRAVTGFLLVNHIIPHR